MQCPETYDVLDDTKVNTLQAAPEDEIFISSNQQVKFNETGDSHRPRNHTGTAIYKKWYI